MELIVLKMPPDKVKLMADALQRDLNEHDLDPASSELAQILVWLRYRHGKWLARQSVAQVRNQKPRRPNRR